MSPFYDRLIVDAEWMKKLEEACLVVFEKWIPEWMTEPYGAFLRGPTDDAVLWKLATVLTVIIREEEDETIGINLYERPAGVPVDRPEPRSKRRAIDWGR